jgi:hypothetical protein
VVSRSSSWTVHAVGPAATSTSVAACVGATSDSSNGQLVLREDAAGGAQPVQSGGAYGREWRRS